MKIVNARLRDREATGNHGEALYEIFINGTRIEKVVPQSVDVSPEIGEGDIDAGGKLVTGQFVEAHIHLDYAFTAGQPRVNESGTLFEAIEIWRERKELGLHNAEAIRENALKAAKMAASHGVGFIRSHVDVTDPELIALDTLLEVKEDIAPWMELQLVAFPQNGIYAYPGGDELMKRAVSKGADVIGGIPHLEPTREAGVESVKFSFELAEKHGLPVDIHCDEIDDAQSRFIEVMAAEATQRSMGAETVVSHAVAMGYYEPGYLGRLLPKLKNAGLSFAIAPNENLHLQGRGFHNPVPRGVAPVKTLTDWEIPVSFCQDSISDPWYPMGSGDPLRVLDSGLHVGHMLDKEHLANSLDHITYNPAGNLGIQDDYGVREGARANLIVLDATSDQEAIQYQADVLVSIHDGTTVFTREPEHTQWQV
ncbi:amidohydrolase family protein [Corynebacterium sp. S7]